MNIPNKLDPGGASQLTAWKKMDGHIHECETDQDQERPHEQLEGSHGGDKERWGDVL